jgi:hypothetical protein
VIPFKDGSSLIASDTFKAKSFATERAASDLLSITMET